MKFNDQIWADTSLSTKELHGLGHERRIMPNVDLRARKKKMDFRLYFYSNLLCRGRILFLPT